MKLRILAKDQSSGANGCPSVYVGSTGEFVVQGPSVDAATFTELENVLPGEAAVRIAPEVILDAAARYRAAGQAG